MLSGRLGRSFPDVSGYPQDIRLISALGREYPGETLSAKTSYVINNFNDLGALYALPFGANAGTRRKAVPTAA
jgi:hypothetical protein